MACWIREFYHRLISQGQLANFAFMATFSLQFNETDEKATQFLSSTQLISSTLYKLG